MISIVSRGSGTEPVDRSVVRRLVIWLALVASVMGAILPLSTAAAETQAIVHALVDDAVDDLVVLRHDHDPDACHLRQAPLVTGQRGTATVPPLAPAILTRPHDLAVAHAVRLEGVSPDRPAPRTPLSLPVNPRAPPFRL